MATGPVYGIATNSDVTKPYKIIGFGAIDVTKPYDFIGSGANDVTKPWKFAGFGAIDATKPYGSDGHSTELKRAGTL